MFHAAQVGLLKSTPCEKILADFCTSALPKALKFNLVTLKKADDQLGANLGFQYCGC